MIKKYLRDFYNAPIGVLMGDVINGRLVFGWSVVHPLDRFDKKKGDMIAFNRLHSDKHQKEVIVPNIMFDEMDEFILRCQKYFHQESSQYLINGYELAINLSRANAHMKNTCECECVDCDCCDETESSPTLYIEVKD